MNDRIDNACQPNREGESLLSENFAILRNKFVSVFNMNQYHFHDGYEIYYLMSGERNYFIQDNMYRITKGDMIFIDAGVPHRATTTNRLERERVIINFKQELLQSKQELLDDSFCPFGSDSPVLSLHVNEQKYVEELFHRMCEEYQGKRRNYLICIEALLVELLVFAIRCNETRLERPKKQPKPLHPVIIEAMRYIDRHYAERLTLDSISERFSTSKYYLSRLFKTTGCTFVEYVAHVRTTEAQKLLRESDWSVTRVAEEVGFDNLAHFYKTFKHYSSHSPLKYRKINRLI